MLPGPPKQGYSRPEARRVLGISERQLRSWERQELVPALEQYAFSDLIALRTLEKLRRNRVPAVRIRRAVAALRQKLRGVSDPLRDLKIVADGSRIAVLLDGQKMEPVSGQLLLDFDREELSRLLSFPRKEPAAKRREAVAAAQQEAEDWFLKGLDLEQAGAPLDDIIQAYTQAVELDPGHAGAMVNLGTIHYHLRAWGEAEKWYLKALEADPGYALAHFNLGNLHDEKGDADRAFSHYEAAIKLDPGYADAHYNLALLCQGRGETMRAVRHWKAYLKLEGSGSWAVIARRELEKLTRATVVAGSRVEPQGSGIRGVS